jgi:hypothetical protein
MFSRKSQVRRRRSNCFFLTEKTVRAKQYISNCQYFPLYIILVKSIVPVIPPGYYNGLVPLATIVDSSMSLPDRASTLREASKACKVGPLYGGSLKFYTELDAVRRLEAIGTVNTELDTLDPEEFETLLFTGHRGCGKSTELRKLEHVQRQKKDYRVVYFEVDKFIDVNDADYTDLYLLLIKQISDDLALLKLAFEPKLLQEFQSWFMEITEETEDTVEGSLKIETSLELGQQIPFFSKLMAKILAQGRGSHSLKQKIRDTLQRNVGRLQEGINNLLNDAFLKIQKKGYAKGFLVIFDNLDRVPLTIGDKLYFDYSAQLQGIRCTIIYTAPISVIYSDRNASNSFDRKIVVPMVDIYNSGMDCRDLSYSKSAVQRLGAVIYQRMDVDSIFEDRELVDMLVAASGGNIRQLMQMTTNACLIAGTRQHQQVMQEDIKYAIKQEQFNFERFVPPHHYPLLVEICATKRVKQDEDGRKMLFNTSVLEYEGEDRCWHYVNPVIRRSTAFLEAMIHVDD